MSGSDSTNDSVTVPAQSQTLTLGNKKVSDLIGSDVKVEKDGSVVGTLKYVSNYREFNESNPEEQSGNYFPMNLDAKYRNKPITVENKEGKTKTATDTEWILRIKDEGSTFTFKDDQTEIVKLNFAKATLGVPMGADAVSVPPQSKDFGRYGKTPELIDEDVTIKWDGINGEVSGTLKYKSDYTMFSDPEKQNGHYYPLVLSDFYKGKSVTVNSKTAEEFEWIVYIDENGSKKITVKYDETTIAVLDFNKATFAPQV